MELVNELYAFSQQTKRGAPTRDEPAAGVTDRAQTLAAVREAIEALIVMLSPFTPHTAEELWQMIGRSGGLTRAHWPSFDAELAKADEIVVPVQINGKLRARLTVAAGLSEDDLRQAALTDPVVKSHIDGKTIRKVVVAKGPLVSIVVS
jgi:leucyl-tRNA synthetase